MILKCHFCVYTEQNTTQRDGMGREDGGGFRMGNTCIPMVESFGYLAKLNQFAKFKNKIKLKQTKKNTQRTQGHLLFRLFWWKK